MTQAHERDRGGDLAPGQSRFHDAGHALRIYLTGLVLALVLTAASFAVATSGLVWAPAIPVALVVLAVAQMSVHIVFFLHVTTGPDGVNNVLALAFGVLIVILVVGGSIWIVGHLNLNMMPMDQMMRMQR